MKIIALALVLEACSLVPAYHPPDIAMPLVWSGERTSTTGVEPMWWRGFGTAELNTAMARCFIGNLDVKAAYARVAEARANATIAGASRYPSIDIAGNANAGVGSTGAHSLYGEATYELDFWGKNRAAANAAAALADASVYDAQTVVVTLQASLVNTYFEVVSLRARVTLGHQLADSARQVLTLVQAQAEGGTASELDVAQQRNALATFEATIPTLQQQLDRTLHRLSLLSGQPPESSCIAATASVMDLSIPQVQAGLPAMVLQRRPDVRAAESRLIAAHFDIGRARAALFPTFTLTAQAGLASLLPPIALANVIGGLLQPVFAGRRLEGQLAFDRAHAIELAASYRQTLISALGDVEDALTASTQLAKRETSDRVAVDAARRASALARARYEAGISDFLTVLTTERALYQAEDEVLQVRLLRLEASVALFRALGGGSGTQGRTP